MEKTACSLFMASFVPTSASAGWCQRHVHHTRLTQSVLKLRFLCGQLGWFWWRKKKRTKGVKVPISLPKTEDCASVYIRVWCVWHVNKSLIEFGCASHCTRIVRIVKGISVFPHKFTLDIQTPPQEVFGCLGLWATNLGLNSTDSEGILLHVWGFRWSEKKNMNILFYSPTWIVDFYGKCR